MNDQPMDLDTMIGWRSLLTDEERMVRDTVRKFARERVLPTITEDFEAGQFREELIGELGALGLLGANLHGYGCAGLSSVAYGLACQELEAVDSGLRSFVSVQTSLVMYALLRYGSEEQKSRWIPALADGEAVGCFGLTEPGSGSDPGGMLTRARRDGDDWVLDGEKMWITNAQVADVAIVWARTGDDASSIRGFVVERGTRGFETPGIAHKLSLRASFTGSLVLDEVRLPEAALMPEARGLGAPLSCLNNARFGVAFGAVGAARFCLETAVEYSRDRRQFGVPLARKQLVQAKLAQIASDIVSTSLMSVHYGRLKDADAIKPVHISLLKRKACRMALDAARQARSILGANGITTDHHVLRHALNLESTFTYEGTDEIHTLVIGMALTGERAF